MDGNAYDTRPIVTIPKPEHRDEWTQVKEPRPHREPNQRSKGGMGH